MTLIIPQSAFCRSYSNDSEDVFMLGRRARMVTVNADSSYPTDDDAQNEQQAALTESSDGFRIVDVESTDGRQGHRGIYVGETLVQRHPPNCFDEGSVKSWKNKAGDVIAITYKDNSTYRVNGFCTDIPIDSAITKVVEEGDMVRVVWKDGEETKSCLVKSLQSRGERPGTNSSPVTSSVYEDDTKSDDGNNGENGSDSNDSDEDNGTTGTSDDDDENVSTGGDSDDNNKDDNDGKGDKGSKDNDSSKNGSTTPPPEKDAIPEPGNSFGFDAILDDATIQAIVNEESGKLRGKGAKDGLSINDWGVAIGKSKSCTISHAGGIDGFQSPTHYWLSQPGVRSAVEKAASTTRSELEAERDKRYDLAMAQWRGNQSGGGSRQDGPAATSNNRPSGSISAGSSVAQGSNYMSGS